MALGRDGHRLDRGPGARRRHRRPALVRGAVPDRLRLRARTARGGADRAAPGDAGARGRRRPRSPTILRACGPGIGAWAAAIIFVTSCSLGLIEVVAPLDLDARLGLSASAIGLLFAASIAVDAVLRAVRGALGRSQRPRLPGVRRPARDGALGGAARGPARGRRHGRRARPSTAPGSASRSRPPSRGSTRHSPRASGGSRTGSRTCSTPAGYAIGPIVGGALLAVSGADLAYAVCAIVVAAAAVGLWFRWPAEEKTGDEATSPSGARERNPQCPHP